MKHCFVFLLSISIYFGLSAQDVAIGDWKSHLPYNNSLSVTVGGDKVYCLTTGGIFTFNKNDNSMETLTTITGLSDIEPTAVRFNSYNNKLLIGYENGNIDIIENGVIHNVPELLVKSIASSKTIHHIYFSRNYAYLSCGFGIVVIDMNSFEVRDTYFIGTNANLVNVNELAANDSHFFAATNEGVFKANKNSASLSNFAEWSLISDLPSGIYNTVSVFNNMIYTNHAIHLEVDTLSQDSTYVFDGSAWSLFGNGDVTVHSINANTNELFISYADSAVIIDASGTRISTYTSYFSGIASPNYMYRDSQGILWIADANKGLVSDNNGLDYRFPNGPASINVSELALQEEKLWSVPGKLNNEDYAGGISSYIENDWSTIHGKLTSGEDISKIRNISHVVINSSSSSQVFASSSDGIVELIDGVPIKLFNTSNSTLQKGSLSNQYEIAGMALSSVGDLWVANAQVPSCLSVRRLDETWENFDFKDIIGTSPSLKDIIIDIYDQIWMVIENGGVVVYDGSGDVPNDANTQVIRTEEGSGNLLTLNVNTLEQDLESVIWAGTDEGVTSFPSAGSVFGGGNFDAQKVFVVDEGGATRELLQTENIQAIAIDGANRKWFGTSYSGAFLMSADGTEQVAHFDVENSPLFSNDIRTIAINEKTGEVYFGTSKGIIAYRGTAIEGFDGFSDVSVFPNPVQPDFRGPISIKGLMYNTTIKITDISGSLVFEKLSEGGQAIWDGINLQGNRVATGVYMVFCTSEDGSKKLATKIAFIH